jgi:protein-S-isoprenylcysteine O-methyltransferase Ste14
MIETWLIIVIHQSVFQGLFVAKNIILHKKTGKQIRGKNIEATVSIAFFAFFICVTLAISFFKLPFGETLILSNSTAMIAGSGLLLLNLIISTASLINLKESWRVGVIESQKTELVISGIYRFTRNPYFVSYLLMFAAYTIILQNVILLGLSILGFFLVHKMIIKEEKYLDSVHGEAYLQYKKKVPRYLFI